MCPENDPLFRHSSLRAFRNETGDYNAYIQVFAFIPKHVREYIQTLFLNYTLYRINIACI